jgi:hypothetical protein
MHKMGVILAVCGLMLTIGSTVIGQAPYTVTVYLNFGTTNVESITGLSLTPITLIFDPGQTMPYGYYSGTIQPVTVYAEHPFDLLANDSSVNNGHMSSGTLVLSAPLNMRFYNSTWAGSATYLPFSGSTILLAGNAYTTYIGQLNFRQLLQNVDQPGAYSTIISLVFSGVP